MVSDALKSFLSAAAPAMAPEEVLASTVAASVGRNHPVISSVDKNGFTLDIVHDFGRRKISCGHGLDVGSLNTLGGEILSQAPNLEVLSHATGISADIDYVGCVWQDDKRIFLDIMIENRKFSGVNICHHFNNENEAAGHVKFIERQIERHRNSRREMMLAATPAVRQEGNIVHVPFGAPRRG